MPKVINDFEDKYTGQYYGVGSSYESADSKRIAELQKLGHLEVTEEAATIKKVKTTVAKEEVKE